MARRSTVSNGDYTSVEERICAEFNKCADSNFHLTKNVFKGKKGDYSHFDIIGTLGKTKVAIEVKERRTAQNYAKMSGFFIEQEKVKDIWNQITELGYNPREVYKLYVNTWKDEVYVWDMDSVVYDQKPVVRNMNSQTQASFARAGEKEDKKVYYLKERDCILHKYGIQIENITE